MFKLNNSKWTDITISIGNESTFYPGVNFLNLFFLDLVLLFSLQLVKFHRPAHCHLRQMPCGRAKHWACSALPLNATCGFSPIAPSRSLGPPSRWWRDRERSHAGGCTHRALQLEYMVRMYPLKLTLTR